ncbi:MAG: hypothetical protein JXQ65_14980 [Candidatus Marinimicrobia bacterium]|nr:hypothetical protein [Candidatus Neomarinimicrobiota bacterium]
MNKSGIRAKTKIFLTPGFYLNMFLAIGLFLILLVFYKPIALDGLDPKGVDVTSSIGNLNQIKEFEKNTHERALWNPNIFIGLPLYFKHHSKTFNIDRFIAILELKFLDWRISWLFLGAIGMFLLLRALGFEWYIASIGSIAFIFWPHMQGLIEVGHNAKIRAICAMPLVLFTFINYVKRKDLISLLWFALIFSVMLRTQHYQIIFYLLIVILGLGLFYIFSWIMNHEVKNIQKTVPPFILAMTVGILMSAQPLFLANEYTPFSTRGGKAIDIHEKSSEKTKKSGGVSFDYATRWSFSPKEMMTLISPNFFGGTSAEKYTGKKYPHLKNKMIQGTYWGDMPFTQSSEYIGIIVVVLAGFGLWTNRKNGLFISIFIIALFSLFLSFGSHFPALYKLFFYYVPYFDKFRAPVMTLVLFVFLVNLMAMYGLNSLLEINGKRKMRPFLIVAGFFLALGILFLLIPGLLSFSSPKDAQFGNNPQVLEMYKNIRQEMMVTDTLRMVRYLIYFVLLVVLFNLHFLVNPKKLEGFFKKIRLSFFYNYLVSNQTRWPIILGIFLLVSGDLVAVSYRSFSKISFFDLKRTEKHYFKKTLIDKIVNEDPSLNRIIELGSDFTSNDLAYHHQIIGGYSAIKPQLIQDIFDNNLYRSNDPMMPVNLPVISMLNGKYIITPGLVEHSDLKELALDSEKQKVLYENMRTLPRAYFVRQIKQFPDEREVLRFLNDPAFKPDSIAVCSNPKLAEKAYSVEGMVEITDYTPNRIQLQTSTGSEAFLVLSEAYYPIGWTCLIDGKPAEIFQVNHTLRGIELPAGDHSIIFNFSPRSYKRASLLTAIFTYGAWLLLIGAYIAKFRKKVTG